MMMVMMMALQDVIVKSEHDHDYGGDHDNAELKKEMWRVFGGLG